MFNEMKFEKKLSDIPHPSVTKSPFAAAISGIFLILSSAREMVGLSAVPNNPTRLKNRAVDLKTCLLVTILDRSS